MKKSSFVATSQFSNQEFDQTDFGKIYFNLPEHVEKPETIEQLAHILKTYHHTGTPVTIRNTGHSVNGQTLTDGVQIHINNIKGVKFNEKKLEVSLSCGATWDEVMKEIGLPKYCTPMFPNNPGQQIRATGNASVGGIGPFSSTAGGLWNSVISLKLVTMEGEIIDCSRDVNPDIFKFALGGFGRIGVIGEMTLRVLPASPKVLGMVELYLAENKHLEYLDKAMHDEMIEGVISLEQLSHVSLLSKVGAAPGFLILMLSIKSREDLELKTKHIKETYQDELTLFAEEEDEKRHEIDVRFGKKAISLQDLVYFYPEFSKQDQLEFAHPYSDYVVPKASYKKFIAEARKIIQKYDMVKCLMKHSIFHHMTDIDILISYCLKNMSPDDPTAYPLSLDLPNEKDFALIPGIMPSVPNACLQDALDMIKELSDLVYELDGKRYLYGVHDLSKAQIEKHYGRDTIHQWQKLKDKLDPKHLLNIGVIEHLDD